MPRQEFSAGEAARRLGISLDTLRRWDREGRIRTTRDNANRRVIAASEIDRLRSGENHELSARNRFSGTVREVKVDGLLAQVEQCLQRPGTEAAEGAGDECPLLSQAARPGRR